MNPFHGERGPAPHSHLQRQIDAAEREGDQLIRKRNYTRGVTDETISLEVEGEGLRIKLQRARLELRQLERRGASGEELSMRRALVSELEERLAHIEVAIKGVTDRLQRDHQIEPD